MTEGPRPTLLHIEGLSRRFGEVQALDELTLQIEAGEFLTLLGPSGCGKTTALRIMAGFEQADRGSLRLRGEEISGWGPQRRGFGMVFQNYALFPHLNVHENVAFGLRARRVAEAELRIRVEGALARVDLAGYADRAVQALSGGQQQRVALARALAITPPLLLLDEPLSNLDLALRVRTRTELRSLVRELGITAVFVTHDQEEAFDLSDRIAVMRAGTIRQIGSPRELYQEPLELFVAEFVGSGGSLPVVLERDHLSFAPDSRWERSAGEHWTGVGDRVREGAARVFLRPEELALERAHGMGEANGLLGRLVDLRFRGRDILYRVALDLGEQLGAISPLEVLAPGGIAEVGDQVLIRPAPGARLHLFPSEGPR